MLKPLAFRVRPKKIEDIIGQKEIIGENGFLYNSIKTKTPLSFILYGPPGTGKTTIAEAYANSLDSFYIKLNAVTSNKKEIENAIEECKNHDNSIIIIDEIHRINKDKQDLLLPYVEDGTFYLIGATTANPFISINKAIRSRLHILEVKSLNDLEIFEGLKKVISNPEGLNNKISIDDDSLMYISKNSAGDFRYALNCLEVLSIASNTQNINLEYTKKILKNSNLQSDKDEDSHYDSVSALQKSIRGSDVQAALYYAARLMVANDLQSLYRRLLVTAYEDIGLANPQACMRVKAAIDASEYVGLPEAVIPLSVAIIDLCLSPKSKEADLAINRAMDMAKKYPLDVAPYLKYTPVSLKEDEKYPYDMPDLWAHLEYLPEAIKNAKFYIPNENASSSYEKALNENYKKLEKYVKSSNIPELKKYYSRKFK